MTWLNDNAAAVQALASVVNLLVTGALVWLTFRYVRITNAISTSSLEQIKLIRESARTVQQQHARSLEALAFRLRDVVGFKLADTPRANDPQEVLPLLSERDITNLETYARQVSGKAIEVASQAAASLRELIGMLQNSKAAWEKFARGRETERSIVQIHLSTTPDEKIWRNTRSRASMMLQQLEEECRQIADL
jgi:hypothetical protein